MMKKYKGFSLLETIVALAVAAIVISFFMAAFIPATLRVRESNNVQDARLLASALVAELNTFRSAFDDTSVGAAPAVAGHFEKSFNWVSGVGKVANSTFPTREGLLVAFRYRADTYAEPGAIIDGVYPAYTGVNFIEAEIDQPVTLKSRVGLLSDIVSNTSDTAPLVGVEGTVYVISLTQLLSDGTALTPDLDPTPGLLKDSNGDPQAFEEYLEGVILLQADFYALDSNALGYLQAVDGLSQDLPARPVLTKTIGIIR